jgi:hypothetical protein
VSRRDDGFRRSCCCAPSPSTLGRTSPPTTLRVRCGSSAGSARRSRRCIDAFGY